MYFKNGDHGNETRDEHNVYRKEIRGQLGARQ